MGALVFLIVIGLCTWGGWAIGKSKSRPTAGLLLGLFLGVIGLIIIALLPQKRLPQHGRGELPGNYDPYSPRPAPRDPRWDASAMDHTQAMRRLHPEDRVEQEDPSGTYGPQSGFDRPEPDWTQLHG